jgi:hypothetical protein
MQIHEAFDDEEEEIWKDINEFDDYFSIIQKEE